MQIRNDFGWKNMKNFQRVLLKYFLNSTRFLSKIGKKAGRNFLEKEEKPVQDKIPQKPGG